MNRTQITRGARLAAGSAFAAVLLLTTAALAGCDGTSRPSPSATALPEGISAVLLPSAVSDEALVSITNRTDQSFTVSKLEVDDPHFVWAAASRSRSDLTVAPGTTSLVSVQLPSTRCASESRAGTRITVQYALGASIAVASASLTDPSKVVSTVADHTCTAAETTTTASGE